MSAIDFGKIPVFPTLLGADGMEVNASDGNFWHSGMSARELYAAMAMQAFAQGAYDSDGSVADCAARCAVRAVAFADALLAELHDCAPADVTRTGQQS